jgi:hypothetical protein
MNLFKISFFYLLLFIFISSSSLAQTIIEVNNASLPQEDVQKLLPEKYLITQKILWGRDGLMRKMKKFELSKESRNYEQDIREKMFKAHRYIGYATLAGMVAQGIVGERLYRGHSDLKELHEGLAGAVNIGYFSSAGLALFAPPRINYGSKGFSTFKLHKYLAVVHLSSMIATNVLSGMIENNPKLKPYHRGAAYIGYGSFFASMIVIHF